jgi:hypothetical protein
MWRVEASTSWYCNRVEVTTRGSRSGESTLPVSGEIALLMWGKVEGKKIKEDLYSQYRTTCEWVELSKLPSHTRSKLNKCGRAGTSTNR